MQYHLPKIQKKTESPKMTPKVFYKHILKNHDQVMFLSQKGDLTNDRCTPEEKQKTKHHKI